MKKKKFGLKFIALALMLTLSYIQTIQLVHISHANHSYAEKLQLKSKDVLCSICYFIQHSQNQAYYHSEKTSYLNYCPEITKLAIQLVQDNAFLFHQTSKNKGPPLF